MSSVAAAHPARSPVLVTGPEIRRTTARPVPGVSFGQIMGGAADLVLRGVEAGAALVGGPLVSAAVREVRGAATGPLGAARSGAGAVAGEAARDEQSAMDEMRAMQADSQAFNLQYMALQEEVQQENRRFTTVSNVLKAKHETAKSAIGNIRA
jgi:hypothetical protein